MKKTITLFLILSLNAISYSQCWESVSSGYQNSLAIRSDGSLWAWGDNDFGQLGIGNFAPKNVPTRVGSASNWKTVLTGNAHTVALKTDGTLWAWGDNSFGQLGNGNDIMSNIPIQIGTDTDWQSIALGSDHAIALKTNGTLWAWGSNFSGQLGDGTFVDSNVPIQIGIDTNWQSLGAGPYHSQAIKADGTLWSWGADFFPQLGVPIQIGTATNWSKIVGGATFSLGIQTDGTLWSWGANYEGNLGDGTLIDHITPVQVGTDTDWDSVTTEFYHVAAIKTNGTLWAWGFNAFGQLGDGTIMQRTEPTQIGVATNWETVSAGVYHTIAIDSNGVMKASGDDQFLQLGNGALGSTTSFATIGVYSFYADADLDGFGLGSLVSVCAINATTPPPGYSLYNSDCNDNDNSVWQSGSFYADADEDNYSLTPTITQTFCYGASEPIGFSLAIHSEIDCNDLSATVYPNAPEICFNGIVENCFGTLSQGCAAIPVNMTPFYNNSTLVSLATAIPAVPYTYPGTSNIKYRFTVTNTTTGASVADIIQTSRFVNIPGSLYSSPGTFTITASAVINDEVVPYAGNTITVFGPTIPKITLAPTSCGATLATLTSTLTANQGQNATGYTFRIRDIGGSTYFTSSSSTRFVNANSFAGFPLSYSTSYLVSVQYSYTDPVTLLSTDSGYGTECTITTPGIPTISMASPTCGSTVAALNAGITATSAANATAYQFRIRLTSNVGGPYTEAAPVSSRFSSLTGFGTLEYNSSYSVSVRYSVGAQWSEYGPECIINTPNLPTTQLVPSQCGQVAATTLTQQLNIVAYPGFPSYRVRLTEVIGEDLGTPQEITVPYAYFRLNQFSTAQNGKVYNIEVAIKQGSVFGPYSTVCDVHTPAIAKTIKTPFKATAYPNPFANNFMLDVKTTSESLVSLKVYDMVGRLIDSRTVSVSDLEATTIGDQYPTGIYNVVVSQEDSVQTVRVVKR